MSLNFPSSPAPGDIFTAEGATFIWTGTVWVVPPSGLIFATEAEARGGVVADRAMTPLRGAQAIDEFDPTPPPVDLPEAVCIAICSFNGSTGQVFFEKGVASLAVTGTGLYTITFDTPAVDDDYIVMGTAVGVTNHPVLAVGPRSPACTPEAAVVQVGTTGGQFSGNQGFAVASPLVHVGIFR
jgi:hypothetical protein